MANRRGPRPWWAAPLRLRHRFHSGRGALQPGRAVMSQQLSLSDLPDLGRGAAFLGTGGGGNPYVGRLMVEDAMRDAGSDLELLDLADVPDDGLIIPTAMMGAPTRSEEHT